MHTDTPRVGRGRSKFKRRLGESQDFLDSPEIRRAGQVNAATRPTLQVAAEGQEAAGEEVQAPAPGSGTVEEEEREGQVHAAAPEVEWAGKCTFLLWLPEKSVLKRKLRWD